jgi:type I restriction enzyme S subunit
MSRQAYPKYKPSGAEWLGDVPDHWEAIPLKRTFVILNGSTPKSGEPAYWDGEIPWATPDDLGDLKGNTLETTRRMITQEGYESCGTSLAPAGSLVLSTRAPIGHLAVAGISLCTNQGCRCLVFRNTDDHRFYYYQLLAAKGELESWGQGSTFRELSRDKLCVVRLLRPPSPEQRAVAAFLDRETARIDALIEKKRRQIELLQEKRSALISHAVTKGLDPNAPMKDSGIEWLGKIPKHWEIVSLRRYLRVSSGDMISVNEFCEEGYPVFGGNGFRGHADRWNTESDTIIIGRYGALCGNVRVTTERIWATEHAFRVTPLKKFYPKFLSAVIETLDLNRLSARTAQPGLNSEMVRNNVVGIPPSAEQERITDFLVRETSRADALVSKIEASIDMLREYRTALISAAVTGKIDVREEGANAA